MIRKSHMGKLEARIIYPVNRVNSHARQNKDDGNAQRVVWMIICCYRVVPILVYIFARKYLAYLCGNFIKLFRPFKPKVFFINGFRLI